MVGMQLLLELIDTSLGGIVLSELLRMILLVRVKTQLQTCFAERIEADIQSGRESSIAINGVGRHTARHGFVGRQRAQCW